jgi:hypothetical protein
MELWGSVLGAAVMQWRCNPLTAHTPDEFFGTDSGRWSLNLQMRPVLGISDASTLSTWTARIST